MRIGCLFRVEEADSLEHVLDFLERVADEFDVLCVVHGHLNLALEDAIGRLERDALDGELRHASQHIGNGVEDALRIHALDTNERVEEFLLMR